MTARWIDSDSFSGAREQSKSDLMAAQGASGSAQSLHFPQRVLIEGKIAGISDLLLFTYWYTDAAAEASLASLCELLQQPSVEHRSARSFFSQVVT